MNYDSKIIQNQIYFVFFAVFVFLSALYMSVPGGNEYWLQYWWMFPVALLIALVVNTVGISGAALFVPFFILIFPLIAGIHLPTIDTVKLGLITESFGLTSSALAFLAFGLVDTTLAKKALIRAVPLVLTGVFFVFFIPKAVLYVITAALLLISVFLIRYERVLKKKRASELHSNHVHANITKGERVTLTSKDEKTYYYCRSVSGAKKRFAGYGIGAIFQGATGFGIGEMGIISMIITHIPIRIAIGTSHFIVAGTAITASIAHFILASSFSTGMFPWNIPIMTVPAVIIGGQLAPHVAAKLSTKYLERFVSLLFIIIAISLIILAFN